jgi:RNA polymerase sigma-70 factor (ECF subfamily)
MSIALRYTANRAEAEDVLNEAFLKTFTKIDQYDEDYAFKHWLRKIIIHTAIDHQRKYHKIKTSPPDNIPTLGGNDNEGWENLLYEDVLEQVQSLPPAYRLGEKPIVLASAFLPNTIIHPYPEEPPTPGNGTKVIRSSV